MKAVCVLVTGKVQGVGFRHFVCTRALSLGVVGRVWNREDGAVELEAQAEDEHALEELVESLWTGPGQVDDVVVEGVLVREGMAGFSIAR